MENCSTESLDGLLAPSPSTPTSAGSGAAADLDDVPPVRLTCFPEPFLVRIREVGLGDGDSIVHSIQWVAGAR